MKRIAYLFLPHLILCAPALGQAQFQDLTALDRAIEAFTGVAAGSRGGATQTVDSRLRLAPCATSPSLSWYGTDRTAVEIRCAGPIAWKIFATILQRAAPEDAAAPVIVMRGDAVSVVISGDGFSVQRAGEAMDSGSLGTWVRVRLDSKASALRARVTGQGAVGIDLP